MSDEILFAKPLVQPMKDAANLGFLLLWADDSVERKFTVRLSPVSWRARHAMRAATGDPSMEVMSYTVYNDNSDMTRAETASDTAKEALRLVRDLL